MLKLIGSSPGVLQPSTAYLNTSHVKVNLNIYIPNNTNDA